MKILVTGGAGFIGSHIVDECLIEGYQVVVVDNLSTGKRENLNSKAKFYELDILQPELMEIINIEKPDIVIHQAAQISVGNSLKDPLQDATNNILATINLLEACRLNKVQKIVYASTAAVYGDPEIIPVNEQNAIRPLSQYGLSKFTAESYLDVYNHLYGLDYTILRYANVYGPRQDPHGEGGVIAIYTDRVISDSPLTIYGDGTQTRDFIYVVDIARANICALSNGSKEIFNIGTGQKTSLLETIEIFDKLTHKAHEIVYLDERNGDIKHSLFDISKAQKVLEWSSKISLEQGLRSTYEYYK